MKQEKESVNAESQPLALLYVRVSTARQAEFGGSLEHQATTLEAAARGDGFRTEVVSEEGKSAKTIKRRPALKAAIGRLDKGEAAALYATRLDRVSRSVADFAWLMNRARRMGWRTRILDVNVDTDSPSGEFLLMVLAAAAQYENRLRAARTKEGMAVLKSRGKHMGRKGILPVWVFEDICLMKREGRSLTAIARDLNERQVPTALGGREWYPSTVRAVLMSERMKSTPSPEALAKLGEVA
jgi:DNA invertase Pin-like site-specific DNA recombinase